MTIPQILYQGYVFGVPLAIAAALFGFRRKEGLWGNVLSIVNVLFSFLIAVGWWESLAVILAKQMPSMLFFVDAIAFWMLFIVSLLVLSEATKSLSRVQVKFAEPIEKAGSNIAMALLFIAVYGVFVFASDLEPVGYPENATDNAIPIRIARVISADTLSSTGINMLRILSFGNLSSFSNPTQFDSDGNFNKNHLRRQQALWNNMIGRDATLLFKGGSIPPRRQ